MMRRLKQRMMEYMSKRMISCNEATYLISYRQDQRLGMWKFMQLQMHLLSCHLCRKYASQIRVLDGMLSSYREEEASGSSRHRLSPEQTVHMHQMMKDGLNAK